MQADSHRTDAAAAPTRSDPRGFILTLSLLLLGLTFAAVITMQLAIHKGWQIF